ncbi:MAG: gamma-glutamyl-gamma-aminobutyrate hydrolase family protein [Patescibacteria group bacterium]|nr:gamma-glutamyl-gamma-aminobutyrate hydrolase family protein [Patescibacteria group bacterium]
MKVLIVDNGTSYLPQLENLLIGSLSRAIKYSEIDSIDADDFDAVVLSGGHGFPVSGNEERLQKEISLVIDSKKPIFGICFGFEVVARAFGAKLELMQNKERGILDIQVVVPDELFLNIQNFQVFESHRWVVKEPAEDLMVLARSKDGVEAIKHKTRPIYGVQFHPEMFVEKTCGSEVFHNFLNVIK